MSGNYVKNVKSTNNAKPSNEPNIDIALEKTVRDHAHRMFTTHVRGEYEYQIEQWKMYIERVAEAEKRALKNHEDVLNKVLNAQQRDDQRGAMFAMIALSLLAGPGLSWLTGTIEARVIPKLFSTTRTKETMVVLQHKTSNYFHPYKMYTRETEYNQVAAKVFGELASNIVLKLEVDPLISAITKTPERGNKNKSYEELIAIANIADNAKSESMHGSLVFSLKNAVSKEQQRTMQQIYDLGMEILDSKMFGKTIVDLLYRKQPHVAKMNERDKHYMAEKFVETIVEKHRAQWAQEWLYYGNDPPKTSIKEMSRRIEREIWALWILDQEFKLETVEYQPAPDAIPFSKTSWIKGRNGVTLHPLIIDQLIELDVVFPQSLWEMQQRAVRKVENPNEQDPSIRIEGKVDETKELEDVLAWAKSRKPEFLGGKTDYIRRPLPTLKNAHKMRQY